MALPDVDPLLAGLSTEAAQILDASYEVNPTANYYFMVVSTFIIAFAGTFITERLIAPRLGDYHGEVEQEHDFGRLSRPEKRGMLIALAAFLVILALTLVGILVLLIGVAWWQLSTIAGVFFGTQLPASWSLDFTLVLIFIALVIPSLKDKASFWAAVSAGVAAVLLFNLPLKIGLLVAALFGISVGILIENRS